METCIIVLIYITAGLGFCAVTVGALTMLHPGVEHNSPTPGSGKMPARR
jgi:hypothetical protein